MSDPYLGQISMVGFNFAPRGWAKCDGTILPVSQNPALYALIGNKYGGNGPSTFALPDMRGRVPLDKGVLGQDRYNMGQKGGVETVVLQKEEIPQHNHTMIASTQTTNHHAAPGADRILTTVDTNFYSNADNLVAMNSSATTPSGGSQSHSNVQPIQVINFIIALQGIFPPRN